MPNERNAIRRVAASIPRVLGAGLSAAVATATGDPVTGAVVGETFTAVADDFVARVLSPREEERVATALELAAAQVAARLEAGQPLRGDDLFDGATPEATEVVEGVLLTARDEHEQKKLPYISAIIAAFAFDERLTPDAVNLALTEAERLTWTDLRLLAVVAQREAFPLPDTEVNRFGTDWDDWTMAESLMHLREGGFLNSPQGKPTSMFGLPQIDTRMSALRLTNRGELLVALMALESMPAEDIREAYDLLCQSAARYDEFRAAKAEFDAEVAEAAAVSDE